MQVDIKTLADKCKRLDKDLHTLVCEEFRDGFTSSASLTTSDGILLHTFTLQLIQSINYNATLTHPVTLVHKNKDNIVIEHAYVDEMNEREDPGHALKIYFKMRGACIFIVLQSAFISIDQLEKHDCTFSQV